MRRFSSLDEFAAAKGQHLGNSEWHEVRQTQINMFADATGDQQWIHVDAERAAAGPFGTTVAHGYLTLALLPVFMSEIVSIDGEPVEFDGRRFTVAAMDRNRIATVRIEKTGGENAGN